jgi:hypothetical protein
MLFRHSLTRVERKAQRSKKELNKENICVHERGIADNKLQAVLVERR